MANVTLTLEQKSEFFKELSSLPKATTKQIEEFLGKQDGAHYGFISEFVGAAQEGTLFDADAIYKNGNEACLTASQLDYVKGQIPLIDVSKNPTDLILDVKERGSFLFKLQFETKKSHLCPHINDGSRDPVICDLCYFSFILNS